MVVFKILNQFVLPFFLCFVLPVSIVYIIHLSQRIKDDNRTRVLIKAIETGRDIDADRLADALRKPQKSARETLNRRLLIGCIFSLIGVTLMLSGLTSSIIGGSIFADDAVCVPLFFGGISLAIGLSFLVVYFVSRKDLDKEK